MATVRTFSETIAALPLGAALEVLRISDEELCEGRDRTLRAFGRHVRGLSARCVLIGTAAVRLNGCPSELCDRQILIDRISAPNLADRLMDDPDWERLEIRQYAFLYLPTGIPVDFLVSGDLIQLGRPYYFPDPRKVETITAVEGVPAIGLHDLIYLKLLAGRMRDLGDVMELCKLHLDRIVPEQVCGKFAPEDQDLAEQFLDILKKAPAELANERRLGQGSSQRKRAHE